MLWRLFSIVSLILVLGVLYSKCPFWLGPGRAFSPPTSAIDPSTRPTLHHSRRSVFVFWAETMIQTPSLSLSPIYHSDSRHSTAKPRRDGPRCCSSFAAMVMLAVAAAAARWPPLAGLGRAGLLLLVVLLHIIEGCFRGRVRSGQVSRSHSPIHPIDSIKTQPQQTADNATHPAPPPPAR